MRILYTVLLLFAIGATAVADDNPRVAVVYGSYRDGDAACMDRLPDDWVIDKWPTIELPTLMPALEQYDFLVFAPVWNFIPGLEKKSPDLVYPKALFPARLQRFLQNGGNIIVLDTADDRAGDQWIMEIEQSLNWDGGECTFASPTTQHELPGITRSVESPPCWRHYNSIGPSWKVLTTCDDHSKPLTLMARIGKPVGDGVLDPSPGCIIITQSVGNDLTDTVAIGSLWEDLKTRDRQPRMDLRCRPPVVAGPLTARAARDKAIKQVGGIDSGSRFSIARLPLEEKLIRENPNLSGRAKRINLEAAGHEYACAQVAVVPNWGSTSEFTVTIEGLEGIECSVAPVAYVVHKKDEVHLAEVVRNVNTFKAARNIAAQPIWATFYVPRGTDAGIYRGSLVVARMGEEQRIPIRLRVKPFDLPTEQHLPTDFACRIGQLYAFWASKQWHEQNYSDMITPDIYINWLEFAVKYRIAPQPYEETRYWPARPATVGSPPLVNSWWNGPFISDLAGFDADTLTFDWADFDRMFEMLISNGVPMIRVGFTGGCDGKTGYATDMWKQYLPALRDHLREKGWLNKAYLYQADEVTRERYESFMGMGDLIQELAPEIKRLTVMQHPFPDELDEYTEMWVPPMGIYGGDKEKIAQLRDGGDSVWTYVCTSSYPPYCQLFMREPGLNARLIPWVLWKENVDGLLYYGINFWEYQSPNAMIEDIGVDGEIKRTWGSRDSTFQKYTLEAKYDGGGVLVYPGGKLPTDTPQASLRLELLRQGLQDYEYLWMLRRLITTARGKRLVLADKYEDLLELPSEVVAGMADYTDSSVVLNRQRKKIADAVEKLKATPNK